MNVIRLTHSWCRRATVFPGAVVLLAVAHGMAAAQFSDQPNDAAAVAWIRFVDGEERYAGTPYYWLGKGDLRVSFEVAPKPSQAIEFLWGSKADQRRATLLVNGRRVELDGGGHQGFRWMRVPMPEGVTGNQCDLALRAAGGIAAFLAEIRLIAPGGDPSKPDLKQPTHKARLVVRPSENVAGAGVEAFPEMRTVWDREPPSWPNLDAAAATRFRAAEKNARLANEGFYRSRRFVDGWLVHADPATGLIPRNLREGRDFWNGRDAGADNYAFMVLTAAMTDRPMLDGRMLDMLRTEQRVTARRDRLADDYSFSKKGWRRENFDLDATVFDSAEYVKDGLLTITEWMGPSPWSERMLGLVDDIWKNAAVDTPFGRIPTLNFEVNGDLLQACSRIYWFTGDRKYLDWAIRLGDFYLLGTNHPTRDLTELRLSDHGCEVVNGLSELYLAVAHALPEKRMAYDAPINALYERILEVARNPDGFLYSSFNPKTGANKSGLCDTWGYNYDGVYTAFLVNGRPQYRDAVRHVLSNLGPKYHGRPWADKSQDGIADSVEGALNLFNRESIPAAEEWIEHQIRVLWDCQRPDGVIEAWHGDGNFARTTLMYALWKTQGVTMQPWRADVRFGAVRSGDAVHLAITADQAWRGKVIFDRPRHKEFMHLPVDYPRINQFPEWFTAQAGRRYVVRPIPGAERNVSGDELRSGIPLELAAGGMVFWTVQPEGNQ